MANYINGYDTLADAKQRQQYMEDIRRMSWDELFNELLRVHAKSTKLLNEAYEELNRVYDLLNNDDDGDYFNYESSN